MSGGGVGLLRWEWRTAGRACRDRRREGTRSGPGAGLRASRRARWAVVGSQPRCTTAGQARVRVAEPGCRGWRAAAMVSGSWCVASSLAAAARS